MIVLLALLSMFVAGYFVGQDVEARRADRRVVKMRRRLEAILKNHRDDRAGIR